ncbi:hypothetical protein [Streptomyces anulatus]|uniref:hypothetical protein n=1 Tax=Streptomyces anulatus TaxID=1892 RepID=UPI0035DE7E90
MQGVLTGFTVIATVIAVGYVIGRRGYLGQDGRTVLTRPAFNVATPALLFTMLAGADLSVVLSTRLLVTATATAAAAAVFAVVAGLLLRWDAGRPAAQNLFTYASHHGVAERFARESILLSTLLSVPVLVTVAALLGR